MQMIQDGQCGLCSHFGEYHAAQPQIVNIASTRQADVVLVDECGHPKHAALHLKVTPISGCDGVEMAQAA